MLAYQEPGVSLRSQMFARVIKLSMCSVGDSSVNKLNLYSLDSYSLMENGS